MKILQCCAVEFTFDKFISPLASLLISKGYDVHASFSFDSSPSASRRNLICCRFHDVLVKRSFSPFSLFISIVRVSFFLRKHGFDVVHVHTPIASIVYRVATLFSPGTKVYYTVHGYYFSENQRWLVKALAILIEFLLAPIQHYTFFVSREDWLFSRILFPRSVDSKIFVGNGAPIDSFAPLAPIAKANNRKALGLPIDGFVIGYVGRLVSEKGVGLLIESFDALASLYPSLVLLLCGGRLTSDRPDSLDLQIKNILYKHPGRVFVTGFVDNPSLYYKAMDLFCLPSYREGMPTSLIEAMLTDVIPVCTDIRGSRELVDHMSNGYLFSPGSLSCLTSLLGLAIDVQQKNHASFFEIIESPRSSLIRRGFTQDSVMRRYEQIF